MVQGSHLASASGDSTVKLWSFEQQRCVATYSDHTQAVWGVAFHDLGDFVASCSLDHSTRLWDITTSKCRQSFRSACPCCSSLSGLRSFGVQPHAMPNTFMTIDGSWSWRCWL